MRMSPNASAIAGIGAARRPQPADTYTVLMWQALTKPLCGAMQLPAGFWCSGVL